MHGNMATSTDEVVSTDGRNRRAAETRRKIIAAAKAIIAETCVVPTVVAAAKRADVSVRSVFQHFGDIESLFVTVVDSVRHDLQVRPRPSSDLPLAIRIKGVVQNRAELFEKITPLRLAAAPFLTLPALEQRGTAFRQALQAATHKVFERELAVLDAEEQQTLVDGICSALSLEAWIFLRRQDGLSFERAASVWRMTLTALLAPRLKAAA